MISVLVDHNMEGQAILLWGTLAAEGWLALLEQTIGEENTPDSLPVLTIGKPDRLDEKSYREACAVCPSAKRRGSARVTIRL